MAHAIDWMYARKSCTTCKKAHAHLEGAGATVRELINGHKTKYGPREALHLLDGLDTLVAMKGKTIDTFALNAGRPDDAVLLSHLIGPTGNLRAPAIRVGRTLLIGFNADAFREHVG